MCCRLKWKGTFKGLPTWYQTRNDFNSGKSSFHLHTFLCISSHDTETTFRHRTNCSRMSSFQFSFRMKLSFWCEISFWYHINSTGTSFRIENRKSVAISGASGAWPGAKTTRAKTPLWAFRFYHVNAEQTSLWNKTYSGMKVIPVSYI